MYQETNLLIFFRGCDNNKCKKMKLIVSHFNDCSKLKEGEVCLCCRQFLQLIAEHVLYLCPTFRQLEEQKLELNTKCPVPLCDVMKQITILKKK